MSSNRTSKDDAADKECINAFKIDTSHVFQKDRNAKCAPDTGQWFFHHPEYEKFQTAKGLQLLFVTAEAGGGKSTLMRSFIDGLHESRDRPVVAYFFFKDDDDQLRSYEDALSCIIYQLLIQDRSLVKHAREPYEKYGHGIRYQSKEMWNVLLASAAEAQRNLVCVFDAVDECAPGGRRQLVSDLVAASQMGSQSASSKLKIVVTSRPYQDENHPYTNLESSDIVRHLAGENSKVQADIQAVIHFKAEQLAKKYQLSQSTLDVLIEEVSTQNIKTRSFLAVRMAFELLDSHTLMYNGATVDTIRKVLADIPQSLGDQFDTMLNRSPNKEHARRLFCVILASRKTLKIPELKVLYALTDPRYGQDGGPSSPDDLQIPSDDEEFKQLIRAQCGLFVTFVRSSIHLFHQTAREYLMAQQENTSPPLSENNPLPPKAVQHAFGNQSHDHSWKGCITENEANLVVLKVCLELIRSPTPKSWVLEAFDDLVAGNHFENKVVELLKDKPLLQYAALNWYEHAVLSGDDGWHAVATERYSAVLDVSEISFWVWFLVLADYKCSNRSQPQAILSKVWEENCKTNSHGNKYGEFLRTSCLARVFTMDTRIRALLDDPSLPLTQTSDSKTTLMWTATNGYELIDKYHLAYGEYQYSSALRAVQCFQKGQFERSKLLSNDLSSSTMIWTSISEGADNALKNILTDTKNIDWVHQVPEHIMYRRTVSHGWSSRDGESIRKRRETGWVAPCPPAFAAISIAIAENIGDEVFGVLADWIENSEDAKDLAQQLWNAGGFIKPSFCRRLASIGVSIDVRLWSDQRTALQIAAALWEHEAVDTLIELGADPTIQTADKRTALHWFLSGPETILMKADELFMVNPYASLSPENKSRRLKSRIVSTTKALCRDSMDRPDTDGIYPLMLSSRNSPTATKALLEEGIQVDQIDQRGRTALMHFFCGEFVGRPSRIVKHLLDAGADVLATDKSGHTVLQYWARQLFSMDLGSIYPGYNRFNKSFDALISTGVLMDDDVLIQEICHLDIPLSAAVKLGNTKLCWSLLMSGADPNKHGLTKKNRLPENSGSESGDLQDLHWKPLLMALKIKAYSTAALLIAHGADVTYKTPSQKRTKFNKYSIKKCGTTALHVAIESCDIGYMTKLQTGGRDNCSFGAVGNPEFKVTKVSPHAALAKMQWKHWKKTAMYQKKFKDEPSDTEYELPKSQIHNDSTGDKLLPYDKVSEEMLTGSTIDDPLFSIAIDNNQESSARRQALIEVLLKKGAPVNAVTHEGVTPLACVPSGDLDLARLLIHYGADPNIHTNEGNTPLMRAARGGQHEMVKILLEAGANPDAQLIMPPLEKVECSLFIEWSNYTFSACQAPLTAMAMAAECGHLEVVKLLLEYGADPNLPIVHHAHGRLPSKRNQRRGARRWEEPDSSDSDEELEQWKGYISVGTALSWARDEVRELLLRNGADPRREEPIRECECAVIEKRKERSWNGSEGEYPSQSDGEGTDSELRRFRYGGRGRRLLKWDEDSDSDSNCEHVISMLG